jgi:DNA-directed RNA polymerase sigma subunit (sigma70/sigma32)
MTSSLFDALQTLPTLTYQVVLLTYGFVNGTPRSVRTIARQLALSEASVRRLQADALKHLRGIHAFRSLAAARQEVRPLG